MSQRRTEDEVREILLSYGYIKIGAYIGAKMPIKCMDENGYIVYPTLHRLYVDKKPLKFHKSNPDTINNIKHYIKSNNINVKLTSTEFINATSKLVFQCVCGKLYEVTWDNFKSKKKYRCNNCALHGVNHIPFEKILQSLARKNLTPLFSKEDYIGIKATKLPVINESGYKALFLDKYYYQEDIEPAWFHPSNPYTIENINIYLSNESDGEYICISDKYIGNKEPLVILHKTCNRIFEAKWINLYRKPTEAEPNRHGTKCPYCTGLRCQSLHAVVLKQLFQQLKNGTVLEDPSCRNPLTNCILPTDIVNHNEKIAIEIQSWFHDREEQKIKDTFKKAYWENRGYKVYTPDIRDYTILEMARIFFPDLNKIPDWVRYDFGSKLNIDVAQDLLNDGLLVTEVALEMGVPPHRIYDAIQNKKIEYPKNYKNKNLIKSKHINQQETVQTAG